MKVNQNMRATIICILAMLLCGQCQATLQIAIYSDNAYYFASDAILYPSKTFVPNAVVQITTNKIVVVSDTCCAGLLNNEGVYVATVKGIFYSNSYAADIKSLSNLEDTNKSMFQKVEDIASKFGKVHYNAIQYDFKFFPQDRTNGFDFSTEVDFFGYDNVSNSFFGYSYTFDRKEKPKEERLIFYKQCNSGRRIGIPIELLGENDFLVKVIDPKTDAFAKLRDEYMLNCIHCILHELATGDDAIKKLILEFFELHQEFAMKMDFHSCQVPIGPPWIIYKITTNSVVRIN